MFSTLFSTHIYTYTIFIERVQSFAYYMFSKFYDANFVSAEEKYKTKQMIYLMKLSFVKRDKDLMEKTFSHLQQICGKQL